MARLGAGGMGEVHRARDTRLGREVAVKVLPAQVAADPERRARFEREARAVAALSHPNILALFDVGLEGETAYVVTELLQGQSLRERLAGGPLPPRKAVEAALQICRGLAAAHDKGIVHRDLKPDNVFLTVDGHLKILDFGLVRQEADAPPWDGSDSDTVTQRYTDPGTVLGTPGYMAPEQLRGKAADARSDIFALGATLYETLSGQRAFGGESPADVISAVLREHPPDPPGVPAALCSIVRRCLEKLPAERFQSTRDLAFALEALSGLSGATRPVARAPRSRKASRPRAAVFKRLTFRRGYVNSARFAPDGHTIVYGAAWEGADFEVYAGRLESPEFRSLDFGAADVLAVSASGELALSMGARYVAGFKYEGTLARARLAGGAPRPLLSRVQQADWSPDGSTLAIVREVEGRSRLEFPVGTVLHETGGWINRPRVSPDGQTVAFLEHPGLQGDDSGSLRVVARGGGEARTLATEAATVSGLAWTPDGAEVWYTPLREGGYSLRAVTLRGEERVLLMCPGRLRIHDIDARGRALVALESLRCGISGRGPGADRERDLSWFDVGVVGGLSADGRTFSFFEGGEAGMPAYPALVRGMDGSPAVRLGDGLALGLSLDGEWLLTIAVTGDRLVALPTGVGEPRELRSQGIEAYGWAGWHPDGRQVVFAGHQPGHANRLYVQPLDGTEARPISPEGVGVHWSAAAAVSPDGARVAALGPNGRLWLYPLDGGPAREAPGVSAGEHAIAFTADGGAVYLVGSERMPPRIDRLDLESGERETCLQLNPPDPVGMLAVLPVVITPDGRSYAYSYMRLLSELYLLGGLR